MLLLADGHAVDGDHHGLYELLRECEDEADQIRTRLEQEEWLSSARRPGRDGRDPGGGEGPGPAGATVAGRCDSSPPPVARGANPHCGVDWLRLMGEKSSLRDVHAVVSEYFGAGEECKGLFGLNRGLGFAAGQVRLFWDDGEAGERGGLDVSGGGLALLSADARVLFLRRVLECGMHCTRLDAALDLVAKLPGDEVHLVEAVTEACEAGELVGARVFVRRRDVVDVRGVLELAGQSVSIGRRGKLGSGRYVRCYDKGLETGDAPANRWHRWEVEFSGECAAKVAGDLVGSEDWGQTLRAYALGAVDFRAVTGARDSCRRPRVDWWAEVITLFQHRDDAVVRVRVGSRCRNYERSVRWLNRCVAPVLRTFAYKAGVSFQEIASGVMDPRGRLGGNGLVVFEFEERLKGSPRFWEVRERVA